jgi:Ankyrin repeat
MAVDQRPRPPVQEAIAWRDPDRFGAALADGADVDETGRLDWTALHLAASIGDPAFVRPLIERGARIDPRDAAGNTPLMCAVLDAPRRAAQSGAAGQAVAETIALLLAAGADPAAADQAGATPQAFAHADGADPAVTRQFEPWSGPRAPKIEVGSSTPYQITLVVDGRQLTVQGDHIVLPFGGTDRVLLGAGLGTWDDGEPVAPELRELLRCYLIGTGSMIDFDWPPAGGAEAPTGS